MTVTHIARPRRAVTQSETATIQRRLLNCLPASRFEMQTLSRLTDIKTTRKVPTAAVECTYRPRLLINPDFVAQYCDRDEHLFLLVMHELWHVLLAHTRMYPQMTEAQNIAFDAIINAGLMRTFNKPEFMGFFDAVNPPDQFPHCLLRPPVGWPDQPEYPEDVGPPGTKQMLQRLYPPRGFRRYQPPMYEEVLNLLLQSGMSLTGGDIVLLGNHDGPPIHDPLLKEAMRQASANWPKIRIDGRGNGGGFGNRSYGLTPTGEDVRRAFAHTLRMSLGHRPGRMQRKGKVNVPATTGNGVLPNPHDRLSSARRALGAPATLWAQPGEVRARMPEKPSRAHVYLDVSGSMNNILSYCLGLLLPYSARGDADVYQFSTRVTELPFGDLKTGKLATTGGTNINCVLEHLLQVEPPVKRVLILTDGEVGAPLHTLVQQVIDRGLRMNVVIPSTGHLHRAVEEIATSVVRLPPLR